MLLSNISSKHKVFWGIFISYSSFEVYIQLRTKYIINARKNEVDNFREASVCNIDKFKSTTVAGMFVNPFEEYRPQTVFEFAVVRIMEAFESFYGNKVELHDKYKLDKDKGEKVVVETETFLQSHIPNVDLLRSNSIKFQECVGIDNFNALYTSSKKSWFSNKLPPLNDQMLFTWLGQSCTLLQVSGINFLTDPLIGDHLFGNMGPKRLNKSPMDLNVLKYATNDKVNFVLVSHDHPDHLEMDLVEKIGNSTTWIVPLGLKKRLQKKGVYKIIEMDWWDTVSLNPHITGSENLKENYEIVCVPAMHWSGRYVFDANQSLWCSFIIKRNDKSIAYHAGDTGYSEELFQVIGKKYGPVDLSMLPIGQYCPSWHQKPRHISPLESVKICSNLSSKFMMGIHWGTFKLSSEPILEPKFFIEKISKELGKSKEYRAPDFGLTYLFNLKNGDQIDFENHQIKAT